MLGKSALAALLCLPLLANDDVITGKVVRVGVADGDTITVLDSSNMQYKIGS